MSLYRLHLLCIYCYFPLRKTFKTWGCCSLFSASWVRLIVWHAFSPFCTNRHTSGQMGGHAMCWPKTCQNVIILSPKKTSCVQGTCFDVPLLFHTTRLLHLLYRPALRACMHTRTLTLPSLLRIFVGYRQRNKRMCVVRLFTWCKVLGWAEEAVCPACNFSPHVESDHQSIYTHPSSTQQRWGNFQWLWDKQCHEHNQQQLHLNIS